MNFLYTEIKMEFEENEKKEIFFTKNISIFITKFRFHWNYLDDSVSNNEL